MAQRLVIILLLALALASVTFVPPAQAQAPTSPCAVAAATALAQRGAPYIWGSKGPSSFDCSGLVYYAWVQAGYDIGLSTYDQARAGVQIRCGLTDLAGSSTTCWQAGDLIFLRYTGGQHVSMYIGNGLFADAYNPATGVIIHDVASDPFYQDNYWQSRRIVSCNGVSVDPGSSSHRLPDNTPGLEDLPALLAPVSFTVIQCGACNVNGSTIMPATSWDGEWPSNPLDVGGMVQSSISWLSWRVSEMLRILICWLLSMLAILASILAALANVVVAGINGLWRLMLQFWFAFQGWMTELSYLLDALVAVVFAVRDLVAWIIGLIMLVVEIGLRLFGIIVGMISLLFNLVFGSIGWLLGLSIGMIGAILGALGGSSVPTQLSSTSEVYRGLRGFLEGIRDSQIGWVLILFWGACYVGFTYWLADFVSGMGTNE